MARRRARARKRGRRRKRRTMGRSNQKNTQSMGNELATIGQPSRGVGRGLLSNKVKTKFRYAETDIVFDIPLAGIATFVYRANSMFDPNFTGVGHQPRGFDQLMVLYDHFQVIGSRITVSHGGTDQPIVWGIILSDDAAIFPQLTDYREHRAQNMVETVVPTITNGASVKPSTLSLNYSQSQFFSSKKLQEQFKGSTVANPTEQAFYQIYAAAINAAVNPAPYEIAVTIDYIAVLTEPNEPAQS